MDKLIVELVKTFLSKGVKPCKIGKEKLEQVSEALNSDDFKTEVMATLIEHMPQAKKGAKVDPNEPEGRPAKRPASAYILMQKVHRETVAKANPDLKNTEVAQILGKMWKKELTKSEQKTYGVKNLTDDEIADFKTQYTEAKAKYDKDMEKWQKKCDKLGYKRPSDAALALLPVNQAKRRSRGSGKKPKIETPADFPKKTAYPNAFNLFCKKYREEHDGQKITLAELGQKWKAVQESKKKKDKEMVAELIAQGEKNNKKYQKLVKKWKEENPDHPKSQTKSKKSKKSSSDDDDDSTEERDEEVKISSKKKKVSVSAKKTEDDDDEEEVSEKKSSKSKKVAKSEPVEDGEEDAEDGEEVAEADEDDD